MIRWLTDRLTNLERALKRLSRFLSRRSDARSLRQEVAETEAEFNQWRRVFEANPGLHARLMLRGQRFRHYILTEDLARISAGSVTESEMKSQFN